MAAAVKAYKGMGMEGSIARWYDRTTRRDMAEYQQLAARISAIVPAGGSVLEVAPGPGFLSIELAKRGLRVRAVDISKTFVELARQNAAAAGVKTRFQLGNAAALPVEDSSVDFVVCRAAFKNFTQPLKAMAEMRRVLRPGGTAMLIDLKRDVSVEEIRRYVAGLGLNRFNRWITMLTFRGMLIRRAYPLEEIRRMALQAEWHDVRIDPAPMGFSAWTTK